MKREAIGAAIVAVCLGAVLAAWPGRGGAAEDEAQTMKFNVDPGLWEMTSTITSSGQMEMLQDQIDKAPPEKRARMQAMMQAMMAQLAKPHKMKQCLTPERIREGFKLPGHNDASCTRTVTANTATELRMREECTGPNPRNAEYHFSADDPKTTHGTVDMTMSHGGRTMTSKVEIAGKWLGADCGDIAPDHPQME